MLVWNNACEWAKAKKDEHDVCCFLYKRGKGNSTRLKIKRRLGRRHAEVDTRIIWCSPMTGGSNMSNAWFVIAEEREWDVGCGFWGVEAFPRLTRGKLVRLDTCWLELASCQVR